VTHASPLTIVLTWLKSDDSHSLKKRSFSPSEGVAVRLTPVCLSICCVRFTGTSRPCCTVPLLHCLLVDLETGRLANCACNHRRRSDDSGRRRKMGCAVVGLGFRV
jgi:hypothetical protein